MPLVTTKEMFEKAYNGGYAIGAFNVNNMEIVQGITEAAKDLNAPLILQVSKGARAYANHTYLMKLVEAAVIETGLPIALHLDHGDTFELCKSCIDGGFTSVMIDASSKPFAENIALTRQVVEYAHDHGVVVEAELGTLAGIEDEVKVSAEDSSYTHPDEVEEFVTKTGVDSLAIAIGNLHGRYTATPRLNIGRLREINARNGIPLVLHGGSGTSEEDFKACIRNGICKINVATAIQLEATDEIRSYLAADGAPNYIDLKSRITEASKKVVAAHIRLFESDGKA